MDKQLQQLSRRHLSLRVKAILLNTMILSKITFLSNIFTIPNHIITQIETKMFLNIWPFTTKEPIARKTLYIPKIQGGIGLLEPKNHSLAMRLKHFLLLKHEQNQESWTSFLIYCLATTLCKLHKTFRYLISNNILKTDQPRITFYFKDIITFIKKHPSILDIQRKSKTLYQEIIKLEHDSYNRPIYLGSVFTTNSMERSMEKILLPHIHGQKITAFYTHYYTMQIELTTTSIDGRIKNTLKTPKCKVCEKTENIKHVFIDRKGNRKIWTHFQKYQNLIQKYYIPLQHILSTSAISLLPKTKKLVLTLTTTILTHIWKTRNSLQFDDTIISTTNTIINVKNELKTTIQIHYRQHLLNNTLDEFKINVCINNALCRLTNESLTLLL